jgi:hypothetical protein
MINLCRVCNRCESFGFGCLEGRDSYAAMHWIPVSAVVPYGLALQGARSTVLTKPAGRMLLQE